MVIAARITSSLLLIVLALGLSGARAATEATPDDERGDPAWQALVRKALDSSDLRVRVVLGDHLVDPRGEAANPVVAASLARDVDLARGSTDPVVLARLARDCNFNETMRGLCDPVEMARRWTVADTQNQVAWLALSAALARIGDSEGARAAVVRAGEVSTWNDYEVEMTRTLVAALVPDDVGPATRLDYMGFAIGIAAGRSASIEWIGELNMRCKDPTLREPCIRMADALYRDGSSITSAVISAALAKRLELPRTVIDARADTADAAWWVIRRIDATTEPIDLQLQRAEKLAAQGTRGWARDAVRSAGLTESEAARRYAASRSTPSSYR